MAGARAHAGHCVPMQFGNQAAATFLCPYCGRMQTVSRGTWEFVHAQVLMHFSSCTPPASVYTTAEVMEAAARIADTIAGKED